MIDGKRCAVIITAAGMGKRMGTSVKKQFIELKGKPILAYTIEKFQKTDEIDDIILVSSKDDMDFCRNEIIDKYGFCKVRSIIEGGKERQESVYKGLKAIKESTDIILIHDGVRPFVKEKEILEVLESAVKNGAAVLASKAKESLRYFDKDVSKSVSRENIWNVQTPQGFKKKIIFEAHEKAMRDGFLGTDDACLVDRLGYKVDVVEGSYENIKITTQEDILIGEVFLK